MNAFVVGGLIAKWPKVVIGTSVECVACLRCAKLRCSQEFFDCRNCRTRSEVAIGFTIHPLPHIDGSFALLTLKRRDVRACPVCGHTRQVAPTTVPAFSAVTSRQFSGYQ